jgi:adhesin transport system membrane fusion protein
MASRRRRDAGVPASQAEALLIPRPRHAQAILYTLVVLFVAGAVWGHFTPVDVFVRAPGAVRPEGDVVRITSPAAGKVQSVRRREGDSVGYGEVLVQLDNTDQRLKKHALTVQIAARETQLEHLRRGLEAIDVVHRAERARLDAEILSARQTLDRRNAEFVARLAAAETRMEHARNEHETRSALLAEALIALDAWAASVTDLRLAELEVERTAADAPDGSSIQVLEKAREVARAKFVSERENLQAAMYPIELGLSELRLQLDFTTKEEEETSLIRSPARGKIALLENLHPGEYLAAGDIIATLEPAPSTRVVEAVLANQDAEQVHPGQRVRLLLDDSRIIEGKVRSVSPDVRFREPAAGSYRVVIVPEATDLRLGLAMEVRFVTRTESVLSLLLGRVTRSFRQIGG